jgi:hypothetical protein
MDTITVDGVDYPVAHVFSPERALIRLEETIVFVDKVGDGWELSGVPARPEEEIIFRALVGPDQTTTVVIPPGAG